MLQNYSPIATASKTVVEGWYQIKGDVIVKSSNTEYDKLTAMVKSKMPEAQASHLLLVKISGGFQYAPCPNAGDKII